MLIVMGEKIDIIVNVYGKPWQTLCSLKSLLKYSGEHIDKIYFINERENPRVFSPWDESEFNMTNSKIRLLNL